MQHLAAMELAEHLQNAGDLAPRGRLMPLPRRAVQERAEIAVPRVFDCQTVERPPGAWTMGNASKTLIARG